MIIPDMNILITLGAYCGAALLLLLLACFIDNGCDDDEPARRV